jgi:hypothetical protein
MYAKIKLSRKKSLKVHKFSRKSTGKTSHLIERVQGIADVNDRLKGKRDLLLTNLKKEQLPNKHNILASPVQVSQIRSQMISNESVSMSMFNSVMSNYTNSSVLDIISKLPSKAIVD